MILEQNIEIIDLALYLKKQKILIMADFHIGLEEALNKQGLFIPRFQLNEIIKRLEKLLAKVKPNIIIINGDIKHEFGTISDQEWRDTLRILDLLSMHCEKVILIKGNHDTILGPIAEKRNVEFIDYYKADDIFIAHGHKIPESQEFKMAKIIIIGHEHPAITLREGAVSEKYKCYLKGKFKGKVLIVQPSFNLVTEGTDILKENLLSPFLHQKLDNFEVFIVEDKIYRFGRLKGVKNSKF